uniref:Carbonic anhydrase n=1 Tax=Phallusia mammillata TaxID=59560 RepID=A0A6F9D8Y0_9ASCI|nr:carbonic anhydrase 2-like [Phallusia mammillata]
MNYVAAEVTSASNNGHSVTFHLTGGKSVLTGGPLTGEYKLLQFHFHWGSTNGQGSEHTLDGKQFAAELHLVHQNVKYESFAEAIKHQDGLSVIGVFLDVGNAHKAFESVTKVVSQVPNAGDSAQITGGIDIMGLLPARKTYIHYLGSLTTPTLNECVYWISLVTPVAISEAQIGAFRNTMHTGKGATAVEKLVDNWRPVQNLAGRKLQICQD